MGKAIRDRVPGAVIDGYLVQAMACDLGALDARVILQT
jgi:hypothetical protein